MKHLILILALSVPFLCNAQAHLGSTLSDIKQMHPDKTFTINYTDDGTKYASAEMSLGTYIYYFDKETALSYYCIQIPNNMTALNTQVEIYNKKYVIVSETSWKAYLDGGGLMKINLEYNENHKLYIFEYYN
mgnify:CR=1 FL=1